MRAGFAAVATFVVLCSAGIAQAETTTVLDLEKGGFRAFLGWKTPELTADDGTLKPVLQPARGGSEKAQRLPLAVITSARPAPQWTAADFDDSAWPRVRGPVIVGVHFNAGVETPGNPAEWDVICVRGRFRVSDPQHTKNLRLHGTYHGGLVVYVNGTEVYRGHMGAGTPGSQARVEPYPDEAYLRPDGKRYGEGDEKQFADRLRCRVRSIGREDDQGATVPASVLRRGVNVLAVASCAAPLREKMITAPSAGTSWRGAMSPFPHAGILSLRLTNEGDGGVVPATRPSARLEVCNAQPLDSAGPGDIADPTERLYPVRIVAARNGTFSGKVVLSSAEAIRNLKAEVSDLKHAAGGAAIPASAVRVRCAEPARPGETWNRPSRFERLLNEIPAEIPPVAMPSRDRRSAAPPAAVVPLWITVRVPAQAKGGTYEGAVTVKAEGAEQITVPVRLEVSDWTLPDPKDFVTHHHLYQSPETVAAYYKVPLWSEKHWELVGRSLEVLHEVGNRICVLNLVEKGTNMGNSQSMVRWLKQADGSWTYDFSVLDRYLDVYARSAGKPGVICLNIWGYWRKQDKQPKAPLAVTVVDASGSTTSMQQPPYGTPENEAFWKPVLTELRKRLEKRGWFDVTAVCYASYCWPPEPEVVNVYKAIWPDGKWMNASHSNPTAFGGMPCPYSEWVWGCGTLYWPDIPGRDGKPGEYPRPWKRGTQRIELGNPRVGVGFINVFRDYSTLSAYRFITEAALQGNLRGLGRVGGDFWPLPGKRPGEFMPVCDAEHAIGPVNSVMAMTSPGPAGAMFNERLEMFREGVQVAEAIIYLQRMCDAGHASEELAREIRQALDERARYYLRTVPGQPAHWWALESSPWQDRDRRLFELAARVAASSEAQR